MEDLSKFRCRSLAHRGLSRHAPENTLASTRLAIAAGADFSEFDVYLTNDDEVVVFHDETLERTSNGRGRVKDRSLSDLQYLDAGAWFSTEFKEEPIPTLRQILELFEGSCCRPVIEVKDEEALEPVIKILLETQSPAVILAFSEIVIQNLVSRLPQFCCAWLFDHYPADCLDDESRLNFLLRQAHEYGLKKLDLEYSMLSEFIIKGLHEADIEAWCFTVNEPLDMKKLIAWNCDVIGSDHLLELQHLIAAAPLP